MNTKEAYAQFKQGVRIGVVVTNAADGIQTIHEIPEDAWQRKCIDWPDNTNYVIIMDPTREEMK